MKSPYSGRKNALTHGIFMTAPPSGEPSAFGNLARLILPAGEAEEAAAAVEAAEAQLARCHTVIEESLSELAELLEASMGDPAFASLEIEGKLRDFDRLLCYQAGVVGKLRKSRIAILNAAEGIRIDHRRKG